jgi:hypothetical protein
MAFGFGVLHLEFSPITIYGYVENLEVDSLLYCARRFFVYNLNSRCLFRAGFRGGSADLVVAFAAVVLA